MNTLQIKMVDEIESKGYKRTGWISSVIFELNSGVVFYSIKYLCVAEEESRYLHLAAFIGLDEKSEIQCF